MSASIVPEPSPPRRFVVRSLAVAAWLFAGAALFVALGRFYTAKFERTTGDAVWLWSDHRIAADEPEAFFLTREFDLPPSRAFTRIRVAADPEYTLWFNGIEVGGSRADGRTLDAYDVTPFARDEGNRVVLAARSPRGVGGVLAAVDLAPLRQNWIVTDRSWRLHRRWSPTLLRGEIPGGELPRVLGRPPFGRWNYPQPRTGDPYASRRAFRYPRERLAYASSLPRVEVKSGVAVVGRVPARAHAFDFGPVHGRVAVRVEPGPKRAIPIRYAAEAEQLEGEGLIESLVVGAGEREVASPQRRGFRYLIVYDEAVDAYVITE